MVRLRHKHGTNPEDDLAGVTSEMGNYRTQLMAELQCTVQWVQAKVPVLPTCRLLLQDFPVHF
jgi:hypothetical protein